MTDARRRVTGRSGGRPLPITDRYRPVIAGPSSRRLESTGRGSSNVQGCEMNRRKRLTFWGSDENDDSLPRAVMDGRKTVTAARVAGDNNRYGTSGDRGYATRAS